MSAARAFTVEQRHAIERRSGPLALAANAGSGKTSVLVERYVRAVLDDGIAPGRILAITFTDRAAGELRERVRRALVAAGEREAARESAGAFVSTFHSFCARMLRTHAVLAGRTPDFAVLEEAQAAALREAAFTAALGRWIDQPGALELAASFGVPELRAALGSVHDELRSRGERSPALVAPLARHELGESAAALARAASVACVELAAAAGSASVARALERLQRAGELAAAAPPPAPAAVRELALGNGSRALASAACATYEAARLAFEEACADRLGVPAVGLLDGLLRGFAATYESLKRARGMADFDDLELDAGALLREHDEIRAQWSGRFELLMVDELQDTNARQMAILAALERDNLFTVGDEFQSIYGFRHADVGLFRARRDELAPRGGASVLSTNFRSRAPLLHAVNGVFAPRFGERFVPLLAGRRDEASATAEPIVELLIVDSEGWEEHERRLGVELAPAPLWRRAEARLLAARVDRLIAAGEATPEQIVLLFRAGGAIGVYEAALADLGHATLATTGGGFFARPEVIDLVAYVCALANPLDALALYGVLASPLCGCSSDTLAALELRSRERGDSVWDVLRSEPPDARCAQFAERFAAARLAGADRGLGEIVAAAVADHGYEHHLAALHSPERRIANVRKLERLARQFEASEGRDLRAFAAALALGRVGSARETEAPPPTDGTGAIALMTIHSAKGLEFPVVCLADLGHAPGDTHPPALLTDGERIGLRLPAPDRVSFETLDYAQLRAEQLAAAAAEEQRVIYVAMTRARERLILSGAGRFSNWPQDGRTAIGWLAPALVPELPALAASGGGSWRRRGAGDVELELTLCTPALAEQLLWGQDRVRADAVGALGGADGGEPGGGGAAGPPPASAEGERQLPLPFPDPPPVAAVPAARSLGALSYTALADYERCAYRYHLQRVVGLPDVEGPGGAGDRAAARGTVAHALLERFDFAAPCAPSAGEVADAALRSGVALDPGEDLAALGALVGDFARSPLCPRLAAARQVRREETFAFAGAGGELLRGFLDVVAVEGDGTLLIVDYKSDRVADGAQLAAIVERDYAVQRLVYALAGLASGAAVVEVSYCFLRQPQVELSARYVERDRERLEAELDARLQPLREGRFAVSSDPNRERCAGCPGRARLCSHGEQMTSREPTGGVD